jgi:hydrogenase maturation protease
MSRPRILIAGIGNVFQGDDAFGVEVAQRMLRRPQDDNIHIVDFGIRGYDLAYALLQDYEAAILVDAVSRGGAPGTLYTIEPSWDDLQSEAGTPAAIDAHVMNPMRVLEFVRTLGGRPPRLLLVGCEPANLGDAVEGAMGLSAPVLAAVEGAIEMIDRLVTEILRPQGRKVL